MSTTAVNSKKYETLIHLFIKWLESYGALIKTIGEVEKSSGKSFEELVREFMRAEMISQLIEKIPPNLAGELFAIFLELVRLMSKDVRKLTPEEKINVGSKLVELSKRIEDLIFRKLLNYLTVKEKESGG